MHERRGCAVNLVSFSIKTKGARTFFRRIHTVFSRFGFSEAPIQQALYTVTDLLQQCEGAPTFFIPAVVLRRHPAMIAKVASSGAEIGIHGYVHTDYRSLNESEQYQQTRHAISVFQGTRIPFQGFRNPYLGWTEESLRVFTALGFTYESNEAIQHPVIDLDRLTPVIRSSYEKSLLLYRVVPCNVYTVRPHFEGPLLRIPISVPDDEMLFDRLHITDAEEIGHIWSAIMQRVYMLGGLYTLNLHPERATLCKKALAILLSFARKQPHPVWVARLGDIAQWWKERSQFKLTITPLASERWLVEADCSPRTTLLARHILPEDQSTLPWSASEVRLSSHRCIIHAEQCPCIGLSTQTPQQVSDFLQEQGYPTIRCTEEEASYYACYFDRPQGLGETREQQIQQRSELLQQIEQLDTAFVHFGCWPDGNEAALAISGDIDSVTIQDFFLRILEVRQHT